MTNETTTTLTTEEQLAQNEMKIEMVLKRIEAGESTKSQAFRELYEIGLTVGQIANTTGSHYSFVYGVISGHYGTVNHGPKKASKSDGIRELAAQGLTPGQIAKKLNSNYSFVHSVVKKWRLQQDAQMAQEVINTPEESK